MEVILTQKQHILIKLIETLASIPANAYCKLNIDSSCNPEVSVDSGENPDLNPEQIYQDPMKYGRIL